MTAEMPAQAHQPSMFDRAAALIPTQQEAVPVQEVIAPVVPVEASLGAPDDISAQDQDPEKKGWFSRHKLKLAVGAMVGSVVAGLTLNPAGDTAQRALEVMPWAAPAVGASEAAWIGGMAMMAAGAGSKVGNPFKLHGRGDEIMGKVNDSKLFKAGFWVNAAGAVGTAGAVGAAVVGGLPPETWGVLGLPALDLAATLAARKVVWGELRKHENVATEEV